MKPTPTPWLFCASAALAPLVAGIPQGTATGDPGSVALHRARYRKVEGELRDKDLSRLSAEQRDARERLLRLFVEYRERGDFTQNEDFPGARMPYFVDRGGTRCAIANLLDATGRSHLVDRIAAERNHAWVVDLAGEAELLAWLDEHGLMVEEAARIQGPGMWNPGSWTPPTPQPPGAAPLTAPRPSASPVPDSPATSGPRIPGATVPGPGSSAWGGSPGWTTRRTLAVPTTGIEESWWVWWEMNKLQYLPPNRFRYASGPVTQYDFGESLADAFLAEERAKAVPVLLALLDDADGSIRAASVVALGRIAGSEAIPHLLRKLEDRSVQVRHRAILALGATGAEEAVPALLHLALHGTPSRETVRPVSPLARPHAFVALGLGRRRGLGDKIDGVVASTLRDLDGDSAAMGALLYQTLAPSALLEARALAIASGGKETVAVRSRAVESLRSARDSETLSKLMGALSGREADLRRSAALALGDFENPLALPPLETAFDLDKEPLARGFLLVSIGRKGGPEAKRFLLEVLRSGERSARPWCALALGVLARDDGDPAVRRAIREAYRAEKNQDTRGALVVAAGLARDREAFEEIREALSDASDPRMRMYAALSLAMIGGDGARTALAERLAKEKNALARVGIAQALGHLGDGRDAEALLRTMRELPYPVLQTLMAVALGFHGTKESLLGLGEVVRDPRTPAPGRAAAIEALGMVLGGPSSLALAEVSRGSNFTVFPDWVHDLLQSTL